MGFAEAFEEINEPGVISVKLYKLEGPEDVKTWYINYR